MRNFSRLTLCVFFLIFSFNVSFSITTRWTGQVSTSWSNPGNWTDGVPTTSLDVVIGDASFTGAFQPALSTRFNYAKSLTIGVTKLSTLTISGNNYSLTVLGDVTIASLGTISQTSRSNLSCSGNWSNSGIYSATNNNAAVIFSGTTQTLSGVTTFRRLTINTGSTTTINNNITVSRIFAVNGTFNPNEPTFVVTLGTTFSVGAGGTILVKASTFAGNYSGLTPNLNNTSTVDYAATTTNQTVAAFAYGNLRISGGMTKTAAASMTLKSANAAIGNIYITGGTFDLSTFTVNRGTSVAGGAFTIANGCTLRLAGAFPANFTTYTFGPTSLTEYYGGNQTVSARTYGHLTLTTATAGVTKTMPATAFVVAGNFISNVTASGTLSFTAGNSITVQGNTTIGTNVTFGGGSFNHTFAGNFANTGIINGGTSTFTMTGLNAQISGSGNYSLCNLTMATGGITAAVATNITLSGNLATTGPGTFTHITGSTGTITMTGASRTISGTGISLNHFAVLGVSVAATISTTTDFNVYGNFAVSGVAGTNFNATAGIITLRGTSMQISNGVSSTLNFANLDIYSGASISTTANFLIRGNLTVTGTLFATNGTVTFNGTSIVTGSPNLFNVTLNGTRLTLGNNVVLGVASAFTLTAGVFDVTTSTPNTVSYNGAAQTVTATTYNRLLLASGGTKTAGGACIMNESITIASGVTFNGGAFTHTVYGDWNNNWVFNSTGTVQFLGAVDSYINGATTFSSVTVNKSSSATLVVLNNNVSVTTINMNSGEVNTGTNTLTITSYPGRTGNGIIIGTITRSHGFGTGTAYEFESPANTVTFTIAAFVASVTVTVKRGAISDFPSVAAINREYSLTVNAVAHTGIFRMHYETNELNGNNENTMTIWRNNFGTWSNVGKDGNSAAADWVEYNSGLGGLSGYRWTCADATTTVRWNGSVSSDWNNINNWTVVSGGTRPPAAGDIVQIGSGAFTNQPTIATTVNVKGIVFSGTQAVILSIASPGSLNVSGNITGSWTANTAHTIATGTQNLTVGGDLVLSNGTTGHVINMTTSTGTTTVTGNLVQRGGANITYTGAGNLNVASNYSYTSGTFTPATSTVTYNGAKAQTIAPFTYYNLTTNKTAGTILYAAPVIVQNNLTVSTGGQFGVLYDLTVGGNVTIGSGTIVNSEGSTISVGGNWSNSGTFIQGSGTVRFNGTGNQTFNATTFNNLTINKSSGNATATGNVIVNSDLSISAGTLDLATFTANRTALGGTLTMASGTFLRLAGANNFPQNYNTHAIHVNSTVEYNGTVAQSVTLATYGNLIFSNGALNSKTLIQPVLVNGDITINSGARVDGNGLTVNLYGNWNNSGTFVPSLGTVRMHGISKTISGTNDFYNLTLTGNYSTNAGTVTTILGNFINSGIFTQGSDNVYFYGNLTNTGTLNLNGTTTVMGTQLQTFTNNGVLTAGASGIVNYNGTIAPLYFSTTTPTYATVNINNTAGIAPVQPWIVAVAMNVGSGASFNGGGLTHTIFGSFSNSGTVTNDAGTFTFSPSTAKAVNLGTNFSCTGSVNFAGTGAITLSGSGTYSLGGVNVTNTNVAGITPTSDWNLNSSFLVENGATFFGGTGRTMSVRGNITVNGTLNGGTSSIIMTDTATITGTGNILFNNITIGSVDTLLTNIGVTGNFVNNGKFAPTGYTVMFSGASPSVISGTTTPVPFADIIISKSSSSTSLSADIDVSADLTINTTATLSGGTRTINMEGNWINHGTYSQGTSSVNFIATENQQISGTATTSTFHHVNVLNSGFQLSLNQHASVTGTLTLNASTTLNAGSHEMIFASNASSTGRLAVVPASATFIGNARMQRYLAAASGRYWYNIAAPVSGGTASMWQTGSPVNGFYLTGPFTGTSSPGNGINPNGVSAYTWDASNGVWSRYPSASNTETIVTGRGYRVFVRDGNAAYNGGSTTAKTFSAAGPPNIGNFNFTLNYHTQGGTPAGGWNLIGNPYPSNINGDLNSAGWTSKVNMDGFAIYMWDSDAGNYVSCNGGIGSCIVPSSQAFWVRVHPGGGSLLATENVKTTTNANFYREAANYKNYIPVVLTNITEQETDITYLRFASDATLGFDDQYDAYKMTGQGITGASTTSISSMMDNTTELSINARPAPEVGDTISLKISGATGNYSLDFSERGHIDPSYHMYLLDHHLATVTDLNLQNAYYYDADAADSATFHKRFSLVFFLELRTTPVQEQQNTSISLSPNPAPSGRFTVQAEGFTGDVRVIIHDVLGNKVFEKSYPASGVIEVKANKNLVPGTYVVTIGNDGKETRTKLIVE